MDVVEALLEARAPVDAVDATGASPLIVAAYAGHGSILAAAPRRCR